MFSVSRKGTWARKAFATVSAGQINEQPVPSLESVKQNANKAKIILFPDVIFGFDEADLTPGEEDGLRKAGSIMSSLCVKRVMIAGHTDGIGSDEYNRELSLRRAATVSQWLIAHGYVNGRQVITSGLGKARPIAANSSSAGRAMNRRVEITLFAEAIQPY